MQPPSPLDVLYSAAPNALDGQVLAIAPHPDDVALSVGGLFGELAARSRVQLLTVFVRSAWAPVGGPRTPSAVSGARRAEDERYALRLGVEYSALGLPDGTLRGYGSNITRLDASDGIAAVLAKDLRKAVRRSDVSLILAPLGVGAHYDHLLVRDCVLESRLRTSMVALYEDLPYAAGVPFDDIRAVACDGGAARSVSVPMANLEHKLADLEVYASQMRDLERAAVVAHARDVGGGGDRLAERLWLLS